MLFVDITFIRLIDFTTATVFKPIVKYLISVQFLPRDASAERGDEIARRLSVRPSVCP